MVFTKVQELKTSFLEFMERKKEEMDEDLYDSIVDWFSTNTKKTRVKKEKEEKDPNRVKKSVPPSWLWKAENKEKIKEEHFGGENVKGSLISKKAKEIWENELTEEEKQPYIEMYNKQMAKYREANPSKTTKKEKKAFNFDENEEREIPESWDGPHEDKLLWKYANGRSIGQGRFDTFAEALEAANKLPECGGITMGKNGYTLRKGNDPITDDKDDKNGPFVSWTKKAFTMPKKENMKKKTEKKPKSKKDKEEKKEEVEATISATKDEEPETIDEEKVKFHEVSESESETETNNDSETSKALNEESDEDTDEDTDDEPIQVNTWVYKGTSYLVDGENVVYDSLSEEKIGIRVSSKKTEDGWKLKKE